MTTNLELLEAADRECVEALAMLNKGPLSEALINAVSEKISRAQQLSLAVARDHQERR